MIIDEEVEWLPRCTVSVPSILCDYLHYIQVIIDEEVEWLPRCTVSVPSILCDYLPHIQVIIDEEVEWLPRCTVPVPSIEQMRMWKVIGQKKRTIDDETKFCDPQVLKAVLSSKVLFVICVILNADIL